MECSDCRSGYELSAVRAALGCERDFAEALRAGLGGRGCDWLVDFFDHVVGRHNDREIDGASDKDKVDQRVQQFTDVNVAWNDVIGR